VRRKPNSLPHLPVPPSVSADGRSGCDNGGDDACHSSYDNCLLIILCVTSLTVGATCSRQDYRTTQKLSQLHSYIVVEDDDDDNDQN
jgi:hypothetical protein